MEELSSSYPYSMDWLIDYKNRSLVDFYKNSIVYLSFCGLGSASDIMNMTITEIENLKGCMTDEDLIKFRLTMLGIKTSD